MDKNSLEINFLSGRLQLKNLVLNEKLFEVYLISLFNFRTSE